MIELINGKVNLKKLELEDIIDRETLQQFLDDFAIGMNCAAVSVDRKGEEFTHPSHYRPFCSDYIHKSAIGDARCAECHNRFGERAIKIDKPYIGECHAGLIDFAAPVIIEGEHLGTVLGGQILSDSPKETSIRKVANEIHVNDDGLWSAAQNIDIVSKINIEAAARVLYTVVNKLALTGYHKIQTEILSSNLAENFIQISDTVEFMAKTASNITVEQHELVDKIGVVSDLTGKISSLLHLVNEIAARTKILGINAKIEAARAGSAGLSFGIVATEIQSLSENVKETASRIHEFNATILENINGTTVTANSTMKSIEDQGVGLQQLSATSQSTVAIAEKLKELFANS